jgi:hypothetical protein
MSGYSCDILADSINPIGQRVTTVQIRLPLVVWAEFLTHRTFKWGRDEFEGLVRMEIKHGIPSGSVGRISDGIPNRTHQLRGLGNAVVPQVAEWIGRRIVEAFDNFEEVASE